MLMLMWRLSAQNPKGHDTLAESPATLALVRV
ncbi:hypothetical protein Asd1617_00777 [Shigella dysenteriae 1617]|uniref:Uncharacterized protein n=1 Tax=Shigella dysenteriae 1617 TaxID=754093 RepID=A0A0A6ZNU4_SHIDY|nr:hypothetical protein Asd1617_00777 [Shigella dysenteriae 1617]